jgi:hypothetical protein
MPKVLAGITTSVDGYIAGPDDGPDRGLGVRSRALLTARTGLPSAGAQLARARDRTARTRLRS